MPKLRLRHAFVAVMIMLAMLAQGTWALAGTTGNISGTLTDSTNGKAIADAKITVVSPSQSASATTDAGGHFTILSLTPDTYTVSVEKDGYTPTSLAGVTVFADQTQTLALTTQPQLKTIAKVTSRATGALVKPGTTSDVYSVNAATAAKVTGLGGGGSLDQAYSAIATMPGAYVPVGGAGWYQTVYIRGGDYDQVGYEVDGVPVNRAFDNYPSSTASALGQQEVQVYTGANPANSEGQGLSGYINQVIKTGTYPGFGNADLALGGPIFYHKAMVEAGGATPNRNFSYYAGFAGYNQSYRYLDNNEGSGIQSLWGTPFIPCPDTAPAGPQLPGCYNSAGTYMGSTTTCDQTNQLLGYFGVGPLQYNCWFVMGPTNYDALYSISDRENVVNFTFGIPHKYDGGKDNVQLLWQASDLKTMYHLSPSDWGPTSFYNNSGVTGFLGLPVYPSSQVYTGPVGVTVPQGGMASGSVINYGFPSAPADLANGGLIPVNEQDSVDNAIGLVKLQYQKNFGSSAYLRLYGYSTYSDWFNWGPNSANDLYSGSIPSDYELSTHTTGVSGTFADQINPENLLQVQASYTRASSLRMYNLTQFYGGSTRAAVLVSSANPTNGICYDSAGNVANCDGGAAHVSVSGLSAALPQYAGTTCGGATCEWLIADNGHNGNLNLVVPKFTSASITDEWDPSDALHLNLGVRFDRFEYDPSKTDVGMRPFWTNAFNNSWCVGTAPGIIGSVKEKANPSAACATGYTAANVTDVSQVQSYSVFQPRLGLTYTLDPLNVLRFSGGEYDQAPNAAFEQYDALQQNLADKNRNFLLLGFNAPTHHIVPEISYNFDASWEHQFKGTDVSFKVTPFYRRTKDQIQQFYLDLKTNFVSGLNVGQQTSDGVEFELSKGDFNRNGFSGLLSYTYTNASVKYKAAPNGATPITTIDQQIGSYNAFTSACNAANGGSGSAASSTQYGIPVCSATDTAFPCYKPASAGGGGDPTCAAGDIANPYWNAKPATYYDPFGSYAPYDLFAGPAPGAGNYGSFVAPHVATLVLNYKHDKFSITPAFQLSAGNKWGYPISTLGVDPSACTAALAGSTTSDPRYPNGAAGGSPYDASSCIGGLYSVPIPNPATGKFDPVGGFTDPARLTISTQVTYEVSPRITGVLTLANLYDGCFGGTKGAWTNVPGVKKSWICGYGSGYLWAQPPIGNNFNPGASVQPWQANSYYPGISHLPFNAYLDFKIKL